MLRIPQQTNTDCAVCCLAMMLGKSYDEILKCIFPNCKKDDDLSIKFELLEGIIESFGWQAVVYGQFPENPSDSGILEISYLRNSKTVWHYIVYDGKTKMFIDPQENPPAVFERQRFVVAHK